MEGFDGSEYLSGWGLSMIAVQMALKAAMELNVFNIIANAGPNAQLSCVEIVSKIPTTNPNAAVALDRILRTLTFNSILTASLRPCKDGTTIKQERTYGLTPKSCSPSDRQR
ncbi:(S)-scoulerine 9-O-methyltransferase [Vitis vinifera]|uniref:(S)-scoulerine 9-O-methyltransferase n=1 Tax=Vitis vinifera TaxID=29760 RepID=A0A438CKE6_VITVI|nr:(S)-scoulerine 9-O-methyltransferase [Vitis vinifera]